MNRSAAACTAILSPIAAWVAVAALTQSVDLPSAVPPGRENRAAIAIRDDVSAFQKWGSRQFTHAWLLAVICCGPALLGGALYLQALLVFLGWV